MDGCLSIASGVAGGMFFGVISQGGWGLRQVAP